MNSAPESRFRTDFRFWDYRGADGRPRPNPEPARIYGPVCHIGPLTVCAYAVATAEGLVVIDTGYARDGDLLAGNLRKLGLDPADVRLVVNTHWHADHVEGNARLVELSGAQVAAHRLDAGIIESGTFLGRKVSAPCRVDRKLEDGEVLSLGGLDLTVVHTPGQSPGSIVIRTTVDGPEGPCRTLFAGDSTGFKSNPEDFEAYGYPGVCADYRRTVGLLRGLEFDLYLGGHPHQVRDEMRADGNPFVTRQEWLKLLDGRLARMERFLARFPECAKR
jgi:metallo-beta-lactamase class B